jgi:mono/diheme cytochrome c family protein
MNLTYKYFFALTIGLIGAAFTPEPEPNAPLLYEKYCTQCHGNTGNKGALGVKKLTNSTLDDASARERIQLGKKRMPAFESVLTQKEITALVEYVKTFRK